MICIDFEFLLRVVADPVVLVLFVIGLASPGRRLAELHWFERLPECTLIRSCRFGYGLMVVVIVFSCG